MSYYKWERIMDTGIRAMGVSGILAIGHTGLYRPIENLKLDTNICFNACIPYYEGYLLVAPGVIVYSDISGNCSETKVNLNLVDGVFMNGLMVMGTADGKILYGRERLKFQDYDRTMMTINRINQCGDKIILCGKNQISIMWDKDSKLQYSTIGANCEFVNAYIYRNQIFALSTDGYLNIYFTDDNMRIDPNVYKINVRNALKDVDVYNMYVEATKTNDIYFLCSSGEVGLIPDFNHTKESIANIGNGLLMYAAKLTNDSYFKDMIKCEDKYIIVGYGEETKSCVQTTMLKSGIIEHNILNDVTGPERYVYNSCTVYENKYSDNGRDISDLRVIVTRYLPVYHDDNGSFIRKSDINVDGFYAEIIDVPDAVKRNEWTDEKIYIRETMLRDVSEAEVVLCVDTTRRA